MNRTLSTQAKYLTIGIFSLITLLVVVGAMSLFNSQPTFLPAPNATSAAGGPVPPVSSPAAKGADFQNVPNQVLFALDGAGKPNISGNLTNITQGGTGDCYFLAALMTIAARTPDTIANMVHENGNGTYTVSFHSKYDGVPDPVQVTVTGDLPYRRGKLIGNGVENFGGKSVSWAAIIEKGWAAANRNGYKGIEGTDLSNDQDHDVHNALYAITGKVAVDRNPGGPMTGVSFEQVQQDFTNGLVTLGTSNSRGKLVSNHSYALLGVNSADQTLVLGNPEGGQTTLTFAAFRSSNVNQYIAIPTYP